MKQDIFVIERKRKAEEELVIEKNVTNKNKEEILSYPIFLDLTQTEQQNDTLAGQVKISDHCSVKGE